MLCVCMRLECSFSLSVGSCGGCLPFPSCYRSSSTMRSGASTSAATPEAGSNKRLTTKQHRPLSASLAAYITVRLCSIQTDRGCGVVPLLSCTLLTACYRSPHRSARCNIHYITLLYITGSTCAVECHY